MSNNARWYLVAALGAVMLYLFLAAGYGHAFEWWHPALAIFVGCAWGIACIVGYEPPYRPDDLTPEDIKNLRKP